MEIGVHHGRSFIAINLCLDSDEKSIAVDIFDRQELNIVDRSGKGNLRRFEQNLSLYGDPSKLKLICASSLDINADDLKNISSGLRFVSIDGGHWFGAVVNDLRLAAACAGPDCVIAIDDFFNPDYPEVAAAYYHWKNSDVEFVPLCISSGKMYVCRKDTGQNYVEAMKRNSYLNFNLKKTIPFLERDVPIFTGRFSGMRGFVGRYLKLHAPELHEYLKARIAAAR